ncbi:MAG: phospholipid carrier-dependent glycosyltransferase [bacterium]|nr:phospholipid carrier-dependent glycosyltransferase [bacterium]
MNFIVKRVIGSVVIIIILGVLFWLDVPLDTLRRSHEYPGITYITAHYLSFFGSGGVLAGIAGLLFLYGLLKDSNKTIQIAHQLIIALLITGIIICILKLTIGRIRPKLPNKGMFVFFPGFTAQAGVQSFPSGHTAAIFSFAPIFTLLSPILGIIAYAMATLVAITRIHSDLHFITDVVIGAGLGILIGTIVVHKAHAGNKFFRLSLSKRNLILYSLLIILILSSFLFFYRLGTPGLFDLDESVFAEATREMLETGNWITPYMNYELRFDKPILIYWLMAIAYKMFGINEFAARFWSALNGTILALFIFYFGVKWNDIKFGLLSSLIFLTCLETMILGHAAITDMTLLLFITGALLAFYRAYSSEFANGKRWYYLFYTAMALALLTKGIIGVVFPVGIILIFLILTRQVKTTLQEAKVLAGFGMFLIIALPWYILVYLQNGWAFIQKFIIFHHLYRFTEPIGGHSGNVFYYIPIILFGFFPWSSFLYSGVTASIPWRWKQWSTLPKREQFPILCIIWIAVVFLFFTVAQTKLPNYVAPLFPPMSFLVASWWYKKLDSKFQTANSPKRHLDSEVLSADSSPNACEKETELNSTVAAITLLLLGSILGITFIISPIIIKNIAASGKLAGMESFKLGFIPYLLGILFLLGTSSAANLLWKKKYAASFIVLIILMLLFWFFALTELVPIVYEYQQGPIYRFATGIKNELQPTDIIVEFGHNNPSVIFYSQHRILRLGTNQFDRLTELFQSSNRVYLISNKLKLRDQFQQLPKFQLIAIEGQYLFAKNF